MASFVREVLSATGTLGDKEDFSDKISKIQKKLHDLKSALQNHIDNRYGNFATNLNDASSLTSQMENMAMEIETLNNSINNQMKMQLGHCSKELTQLNTQIQELSLTLQVVEKIKLCYSSVEHGNECVREGRWLEAAKTMNCSLQLVRNRTCVINEDDVYILPAIKKELMIQQEKLQDQICNTWSNNVTFSQQQVKNALGETHHTLKVNFFTPSGDYDTGKVTELVQAMDFCEILEDKLADLGQQLKQHFLVPILTRPCSLRVDPSSVTLIHSSTTTPDSLPATQNVFRNIKDMFAFLCGSLGVSLEDGSTLLTSLGKLIASDLCDMLVRECLAPAVPSTPAQLPEYDDVIEKTEQLHQYLADIGFLPATDMTILNYARNVDAIFASKVCQNLLSEARLVMKQDLYVTVEVSPEATEAVDINNQGDAIKKEGKIKEEVGVKEEDSDLAGRIPPVFPLPSSSFQFPACSVSQSVISLMELAHTGLRDACAAQPFCAIRLFHTVRNVFEMWCAVTPTYHRTALETLPQQAAVVHNNAMYLAHQLVTLGFLYKEKLPESLQKHSLTFIDLVPRLREVGANVLLASMKRQREQLRQILTTAGFISLSSDRRLPSGAEQSIKQLVHHLSHLQRVWQPVLPPSIYAKCLGTLLNSALEELIQHITGLEDISADMAEQLVSLLNQLVTKAPAVFGPVKGKVLETGPSPHDVIRFVRRWSKFKELILVLGTSLREIDERWAGGKGPLAVEFPPEEVKQLIRALFQNTERRAALLARIK